MRHAVKMLRRSTVAAVSHANRDVDQEIPHSKPRLKSKLYRKNLAVPEILVIKSEVETRYAIQDAIVAVDNFNGILQLPDIAVPLDKNL